MACSNNFLTQQNILLVKNLIDRNTPCEQMVKLTSLNEEQLREIFVRLRKKHLYRVYMGHSFLDSSFCNKEEYIKQMNYADGIYTDKQILKILFCADMHLCSDKDRPDLVDKVWDTAAEQSIEHIVNLGDVTEGTEYHIHNCGTNQIKIEPTLDSQITYLHHNIPQDHLIKHHILQGNHDQYSNDAVSIDLVKEIHDRFDRKDIICSGMEDAILPVNNDFIHLLHRPFYDFVRHYIKQYEGAEENQIMFCGHAHISKTITDKGYTVEYIPPLCDLQRGNGDYENFTGFAIATLYFDIVGKIYYCIVQKYRFDEYYSKPVIYEEHEINVRRVRK